MTIATDRSISSRVIASPIVDAVARANIVPLTIEQYSQLIEQRIIPEDSTVELLRGVIVWKDRGSPDEDTMGHGKRHRLIVSILGVLAGKINNASQFVQIQLPIACPPDGAPEPDAAIVRGLPRDYSDRYPGPGDVFCVIEVAHTSLERDREDKLPIYALASIPQYVIVNLFDNSIENYTDPDPATEQYRTKVTLNASQTLSLRLPSASFDIAAREILP
jgi:Uma2 family endonuclease